jgi:predicted peptidase
MTEKASVPMNLTMDLLEKLIHKYPIDKKRIYVTGLSMGGFGAWDMICRYPGKFAAAIPICGGGDTGKAQLLVNTPIWAFHGSNDKVVKVILSRNMINAIKANGGNPKYTEYKGVGHDCWINAYKEKGLLEWLFGQKLN